MTDHSDDAVAKGADIAPELLPESLPFETERRLAKRVLQMWRSCQEHVRYPSMDHLLETGIGPLMTHTYTFSRIDGADEPVFERLGEMFRDDLSSQMEGEVLSSAPDGTLLSQTLANWKSALDLQAPHFQSGEFYHVSGQTILYRSAIFPLSNGKGGDLIKQIMVSANFRPKELNA